MERGACSSSPSYYSVLGVDSESSLEEIKRAYRKLAMRWHPDRWTRTPSLLGQAKRKFQQIQEAYSVLSDKRKRALYDAGMYDPEEEEDEGFAEFMHEMLSLMAQNKREDDYYSLEELQMMLREMTQGLELPSWDWEPSDMDGPGSAKRLRCDINRDIGGGSSSSSSSSSYPSLSGWGAYGASSYCR